MYDDFSDTMYAGTGITFPGNDTNVDYGSYGTAYLRNEIDFGFQNYGSYPQIYPFGGEDLTYLRPDFPNEATAQVVSPPACGERGGLSVAAQQQGATPITVYDPSEVPTTAVLGAAGEERRQGKTEGEKGQEGNVEGGRHSAGVGRTGDLCVGPKKGKRRKEMKDKVGGQAKPLASPLKAKVESPVRPTTTGTQRGEKAREGSTEGREGRDGKMEGERHSAGAGAGVGRTGAKPPASPLEAKVESPVRPMATTTRGPGPGTTGTKRKRQAHDEGSAAPSKTRRGQQKAGAMDGLLDRLENRVGDLERIP